MGFLLLVLPNEIPNHTLSKVAQGAYNTHPNHGTASFSNLDNPAKRYFINPKP